MAVELTSIQYLPMCRDSGGRGEAGWFGVEKVPTQVTRVKDVVQF